MTQASLCTVRLFSSFLLGSACLALCACSTMNQLFDATVTGGKPSIQDKASINLQSIGNPNPLEAVTYSPSNQNFLIIDAVSGGLDIRELDVKTGRIILDSRISTNIFPSPKSVAGDSRGNLWIFPQILGPDMHTVLKYDLKQNTVTKIKLPSAIIWNHGPITVVRDRKDHIYFPSETKTRYGKALSLYRIDAKNKRIEGPFMAGAMPDSLSLSVDSSDLIWASITLQQRPTYVGVTNYSSQYVQSNFKLNSLPIFSNEQKAPGLAVMSDSGILIERIPIGSHLGPITGIYPLKDKHIIRLTGYNSNCFTKVVVLNEEWQGYAVLSLKDVVIPTLQSGTGNPFAVYNLAKDASRVFRNVFGGNIGKASSLTADGLEQFMNQKKNRNKKKVFLKLIKQIKPSHSSGKGLTESSGIHTYCTNTAPLFQNAMAYSDQDWWTVLSNENPPQLVHVYFPNDFSLMSAFQGPEAESTYNLTIPPGNVISSTNDSRDIVVAGPGSFIFLSHTDVNTPNP